MKPITFLFFAFICILSACSLPYAKLIVHLDVSTSEKYDQASIQLEDLNFAIDLIDTTTVVGLRTQKVNLNTSTNLDKKKRFELINQSIPDNIMAGVSLIGLTIDIKKDGASYPVIIKETDYVKLADPIEIHKNARYTLILDIDIDKAIIEQGNDYILDWNYVTVRNE